MAVLEFLAAATWTWVVASGKLVLHDGSTPLLIACILRGSCSLVGIAELFLVEVALCLGIFRLLVLLGHFLWSFLRSLLQFWYAAAHENADDTVVHVVNHGVKQFNALQFEDEQRVFLLV